MEIRASAVLALMAFMVLIPLTTGTSVAQQDDELKALARALQQAITRDNPEEVRKSASAALAKDSDASVRVVLSMLASAGLKSYWAILECISTVTSDVASKTIVDFVVELKEKPEARDLAMVFFASKPAKKPEFTAQLLKDAAESVQTAIIDELVAKEDKACIPSLIDLLERAETRKSSRLCRAAGYALRNLTGLDLGPAASWRQWWQKNEKAFECPKIESKGSSDTIASFLRRNRATQFEDLKKTERSRILVVVPTVDDGDYLDRILTKLSIPFTSGTNKQVAEGTFDSKRTFAILIGCRADGTGGKKLHQALRKFVEEGGSILCTDLAMFDILFPAFPGQFKSGGLRERESTIVYPAKGSLGERLMRDVSKDGFQHQWKLHEGSAGFRADSAKFRLLIEGPDLGTKPGLSAPVVGCFDLSEKSGTVLVISSHLDMQRTKEDEFVLQNLVLNFLIEAQENFRARSGK